MDSKLYSTINTMPTIMNNEEILARFNLVIDEVITQSQHLGLNKIINNMKGLIDNQVKLLEIVDSIINETTYSKGQDKYNNFNAYIQALISKFTINEQCIIIAHFNLNQETYLLEDIEFLVYELLYQTVKQRLINNLN